MSDLILTSPVPVGGREDRDHYPTPRACVDALLSRWSVVAYRDLPQIRDVLDPSCGEGSILDVLRERGHQTYGLELDGTRAEIARERGHQAHVADALEWGWPHVDACLMNPPYSHAEAFVRKALAWRQTSPGHPEIFALLRLSFLEPTRTRRELLTSYTPDVLILPRRPAFDGRGTDSITSAWMHWPGRGRLIWLPEAA